MWQTLPGRRTLGAGDDFFALGGDSRLAVQAVRKLRAALEVNPPVHRLLEHPTVAELTG